MIKLVNSMILRGKFSLSAYISSPLSSVPFAQETTKSTNIFSTKTAIYQKVSEKIPVCLNHE